MHGGPLLLSMSWTPLHCAPSSPSSEIRIKRAMNPLLFGYSYSNEDICYRAGQGPRRINTPQMLYTHATLKNAWLRLACTRCCGLRNDNPLWLSQGRSYWGRPEE